MTDTYDLIAIGAGPAGESATELASFFGHRSAIVERNRPGGTVTTTGGVPTKTLREAALYLSGLREREIYGLRIAAPPKIATDIIRKRTWHVCELLQKVTAENIAKNNVDYIQGTARLGHGGIVIVSDQTGTDREMRAKAVLIAVGFPAIPAKEYFIRAPRSLRYRHHPAAWPRPERHCYRGGRAGWCGVRHHLPRSGRKGDTPRSRQSFDRYHGR